ncbi:MAG: TolC family protein, partial [Prevotellaceae bacterium]|nr:TolC family protein [Prevotellaceae bacterium]
GITNEGLHKDQYKAAIQIEQLIYGGGAVKSQVEIARAESEASRQNWETEMYQIKDKVNQLFFGTLLLQEKTGEADILISELERNKKVIESYMRNGVASQNDLDKIEVEILTANQQKTELIASQKAYRTMLGIMISEKITDECELQKPEIPIVSSGKTINRPELNYFAAQEKKLDAQTKAVNSVIKPQIGAFFQGAYANPGLNMFADMNKNQWSPYFVAGIKFQWNISGWYNRKNDLSKISLGRSQILSQKDTFLYNIELKSTQETLAVQRMQEVMKDDDKIIALRRSILKRTESQLENGVSTINDLTRDIHAENLARQNKVTHEIELLKNIYDLKFTLNN